MGKPPASLGRRGYPFQNGNGGHFYDIGYAQNQHHLVFLISPLGSNQGIRPFKKKEKVE